jgi:hypothetical protein
MPQFSLQRLFASVTRIAAGCGMLVSLVGTSTHQANDGARALLIPLALRF